MQKIIKKEKEVSKLWSDRSGKAFAHNLAPVEITINFSYGSKYDESMLQLHFTDEEAKAILEIIKSNLCAKTKKELRKLDIDRELMNFLTK